jgi:hypothetical protein
MNEYVRRKDESNGLSPHPPFSDDYKASRLEPVQHTHMFTWKDGRLIWIERAHESETWIVAMCERFHSQPQLDWQRRIPERKKQGVLVAERFLWTKAFVGWPTLPSQHPHPHPHRHQHVTHEYELCQNKFSCSVEMWPR